MNFDIACGRHCPSNLLHPGVAVTVDLRCAVRLGYAKRGERQHQNRKREFIANPQIVIPLFSMRVVQSYYRYYYTACKDVRRGGLSLLPTRNPGGLKAYALILPGCTCLCRHAPPRQIPL